MANARQRQAKPAHGGQYRDGEKAGYCDGNGLYLVVGPGGSRQWSFLYRRDGKLKELGLGSPANGVTLATARGLRDEALAVMASGNDPLKARRQSEQARRRFPASAPIRSPLSIGSKRGSQIRSIASNGATRWKPVAPRSGRTRSTQSTLRSSWLCLTPIWQTKPETASRVRGRIERVLNWPRPRPTRGRESGCMAWPSRRDFAEAGEAHTRPSCGARLFRYAGIQGGPTRTPGTCCAGARIRDITASRTSEVLNAQWAKFDLEAADSDEAGHAFRKEAGHRFRSEAGRDSDLMPATQRSLPRIGAMMLRGDGSVKRAPILGLRRPRRMVGS